jgi:hypothetical protein
MCTMRVQLIRADKAYVIQPAELEGRECLSIDPYDIFIIISLAR